MAELHGLYIGGPILTIYKSWDDPPSRVDVSNEKKGPWLFRVNNGDEILPFLIRFIILISNCRNRNPY